MSDFWKDKKYTTMAIGEEDEPWWPPIY